jgi:hypothetical protein
MAQDPIIEAAIKEYANSFFASCLVLKRRPYKSDEPMRIPLQYEKEKESK